MRTVWIQRAHITATWISVQYDCIETKRLCRPRVVTHCEADRSFEIQVRRFSVYGLCGSELPSVSARFLILQSRSTELQKCIDRRCSCHTNHVFEYEWNRCTPDDASEPRNMYHTVSDACATYTTLGNFTLRRKKNWANWTGLSILQQEKCHGGKTVKVRRRVFGKCDRAWSRFP